MKKNKQKVAMPAGIRNKLMAATSMLLVASIMMVSSTYAWFTLSTAPEVTGITTSVGANGNLEIALLTTATFASPDTAIASGVGDSSAANTVTAANVTWGNLVDLGEPSYGLTTIKLMPAVANFASAGKLVTGSFLKTPEYGADGRVSQLNANTLSAIYNGTTFSTPDNGQDYGVRAVGVNSNMTEMQIVFSLARNSFSSAKSSAATQLKSAIARNDRTLLTIAMKGENEGYTTTEVAALIDIAEGAAGSLDSIVSAYANAALAAAAATATDDTKTAVGVLANAISTITDAGEMITALNKASITTHDKVLTSIKTAQDDVANAIATLSNGESEASAIEEAADKLYTTVAMLQTDGETQADKDYLLQNGGKVTIGGGAIGTIAGQVGSQLLINILGVDIYTDGGNGTPALDTLAGAVTALTAPEGEATGAISDTYGYVLDFAFRTNAASSNLLLQTDAANRVYSDQTDTGLATQGGGAKVTYAYNGTMTSEQAVTHLNNLRFVFFDPTDGTVYANARLDTTTTGKHPAATINTETRTVTAELKLYDESAPGSTTYTVGKDFYETSGDGYAPKESITVGETTVTAETLGLTNIAANAYDALPEKTTAAVGAGGFKTGDNAAVITDLAQNTAKKISVLVYLDGNAVRNKDVANASSSGTLTLNLQFSSSAELVPMQNTALRNMTATSSEQSSETTSDTTSQTSSDQGNESSGEPGQSNTP